MADRDVTIIAKKFQDLGCLAYRCKSPEEIRSFPKIIKKIQSPGVQLVMLNAPDIYAEYAPYTHIEDMEEFIEKVSRMKGDISLSSDGSDGGYFPDKNDDFDQQW